MKNAGMKTLLPMNSSFSLRVRGLHRLVYRHAGEEGADDPFKVDRFRGDGSSADDDEQKGEAGCLTVTKCGCDTARQGTDHAEQDRREDDQFRNLHA